MKHVMDFVFGKSSDFHISTRYEYHEIKHDNCLDDNFMVDMIENEIRFTF